MKILICKWGSLCDRGLETGLKELGHNVCFFEKIPNDYDYDTDYLKALVGHAKQNQFEIVFSINFLPIIARACKFLNIKYISWLVDCPSLQTFSETISYPTNYVFVFDKHQKAKLEPFNPGHIFHQTLAFDTNYLDTISKQFDSSKYHHDLCFIGTLYEKDNINGYDKFVPLLPDYMKGYIDALLSSQLNVFGYNFIEDSLFDDWVNGFVASTGIEFQPDYYIDKKYFISHFILNYKCTELDRKKTLAICSDNFKLDMYTNSDTSGYPNIINHGIANPHKVTPLIYNQSKINLNMCMKNITSGIPLRVFDILGCGGFLISNYQPEIAELFEDGKDLVMYSSLDDLIEKIDYYLSNNDAREQIAKSGQRKVLEYHTYRNKTKDILDIVMENNPN